LFYRNLSIIQSDIDVNLNMLHYCLLLIQNGIKEYNVTLAKIERYWSLDPSITNKSIFESKNSEHIYACKRDFRYFVQRIQANGVIAVKAFPSISAFV